MPDCAASCGSDSYVRELDTSIDGRRSSSPGPGEVEGRRSVADAPLARDDGEVMGVGNGAELVGVSRPRATGGGAAVADDEVRGGGTCAVASDMAGDVELLGVGEVECDCSDTGVGSGDGSIELAPAPSSRDPAAFRAALFRFASACRRDRATRSLWQDMQ